jgi:hypothetical protein
MPKPFAPISTRSRFTPSILDRRLAEECLAISGRWLHLPYCTTCGKIGCCDSSPIAMPAGTARGHRIQSVLPERARLERCFWTRSPSGPTGGRR